MARPPGFLRQVFPTPFLVTLLAVSLLTNGILVVRLHYPTAWDRAKLALVPAPRVTESDHIRGNPQARVTVIEYGDFQCPYCREFHGAMRRLLGETDTRWIYRHLPLDELHPLAQTAAEAAECAGDQGRFWEFADELYERQGELAEALLLELALDLEIDLAAFEACLGASRHAQRVANHVAEARDQRITGTPTFFVNGERIDGILPFEELVAKVRDHGG